MREIYTKQVSLLIRVMPEVFKIDAFALHGGTAINLFHQNMPRLSVDIDLTLIPFGARESDLKTIQLLLHEVSERLKQTIPGIVITLPSIQNEECKLFCQLGEARIKLEVNTVNRGIISPVEIMPLCLLAQETFDQFTEARIVPKSQLFGGKIVAALDRQHPRDIFDIHQFLSMNYELFEIKRGLIFCLLSSNRPIHELLNPNLTNKKSAFGNQFDGMSDLDFTYQQFEETRNTLIKKVRDLFSEEDSVFFINFMKGNLEGLPDGKEGSNDMFLSYPAIQWKRYNLKMLKIKNPDKFKKLIENTESILKIN